MSIRPIRTDADHEAALGRLATLMDADPGSADHDEAEALSVLVDDYERRVHAIELPDPIDAVLARLDQLGLERKDLEPILGGRSRVSEVINRKRRLSLSMIRALSDRLRIPAEILIQETLRDLHAKERTEPTRSVKLEVEIDRKLFAAFIEAAVSNIGAYHDEPGESSLAHGYRTALLRRLDTSPAEFQLDPEFSAVADEVTQALYRAEASFPSARFAYAAQLISSLAPRAKEHQQSALTGRLLEFLLGPPPRRDWSWWVERGRLPPEEWNEQTRPALQATLCYRTRKFNVSWSETGFTHINELQSAWHRAIQTTKRSQALAAAKQIVAMELSVGEDLLVVGE